MPTYGYVCEACGHKFDEFQSYNEAELRDCPECHLGTLRRLFGAGVAVVYGNPTTVGQQSEINARRLGKERMDMMREEAADGRRSQYTGPLPAGAKINTTGTGKPPWFRSGDVAGLPRMEKPLDLTKVKDATKYVATGETK